MLKTAHTPFSWEWVFNPAVADLPLSIGSMFLLPAVAHILKKDQAIFIYLTF